MNDKSLMRIIDANINRAAEGLRVLEDIARFALDSQEFSSSLKTIRQQITVLPPGATLELLWSRNSEEDPGKDNLPIDKAASRDDLSLVLANSRRAQEALRVLEEITKDSSLGLNSALYMNARFELYEIGKELAARLIRSNYSQIKQGVYAIIDSSLIGEEGLLKVTAEILKGGVKLIQLRDKNLIDKNRLLEIAVEMNKLCRDYEAVFIVNDFADIAVLSRAHGLHIGQQDISAHEARKILRPDSILGVSVDNAAQAKTAYESGADYVGVGAMYSTATKEINVLGTARLKEIKEATPLPVWGIGGIKLDNACKVIAAGADGVCVVSGIILQEDVQQAAHDFVRTVDNCLKKNHQED